MVDPVHSPRKPEGLSPIKFEAKGAFKAVSRTKELSESGLNTQCESPSVRKDANCSDIGEDSFADVDLFKTPKMFEEIESLPSAPLPMSGEGKLVGFYTQKERRNKINHLRRKLMKHKQECPINKQYKGRSKAARSKARF